MKLSELPSPYIIAEVGSCWRNFEDIKSSITLAKNCGADAVKFQLFSGKELYGVDYDFFDEYMMPKWSGESPLFHHGWLAGLKEKCDNTGIDLLISAFSVDGLKAVDPYVKMHKLASSENNHLRMLQALRGLGKPVLLSTGGSRYGDIKKAIEVLQGKRDSRQPVEVMPLYCVSDYPARTINLRNIQRLADLGGGYVGFSDHSTDSCVIPKAALDAGARVIEKHVNFFNVECADAGHSLDKNEFKAMCAVLRGQDPVESGQTEMIKKHNRRLIVTRDIEAGDVFKEDENFGIYRSLKDDISALSPFHIDKVNGQTAKRAFKAGEGISPGDVSLS